MCLHCAQTANFCKSWMRGRQLLTSEILLVVVIFLYTQSLWISSLLLLFVLLLLERLLIVVVYICLWIDQNLSYGRFICFPFVLLWCMFACFVLHVSVVNVFQKFTLGMWFFGFVCFMYTKIAMREINNKFLIIFYLFLQLASIV